MAGQCVRSKGSGSRDEVSVPHPVHKGAQQNREGIAHTNVITRAPSRRRELLRAGVNKSFTVPQIGGAMVQREMSIGDQGPALCFLGRLSVLWCCPGFRRRFAPGDFVGGGRDGAQANRRWNPGQHQTEGLPGNIAPLASHHSMILAKPQPPGFVASGGKQ